MASKKKVTNPISPERAAEIRADARSGTRWAEVNGYGPACRCGLRRKAGTTDDGTCYRHPPGSVAEAGRLDS